MSVPPDNMKPWSPSGVVTLTTDFGLRDPYVGIMKGVVLTRHAGAVCVDLTHSVEPQDVRAAGWYLENSWRWFPVGTVHLAVVDPGVGSGRRILVALQGQHVFLAPDNGLLGALLTDDAHVYFLDEARFALPGASTTFHGRDVFSPAAAAFAAGLDPREAGEPAREWHRGTRFPAPVLDGARVRTEVLLVDHFGNLISAFAPPEDERDATLWEVQVGGLTVLGASTYADVPAGGLVALIDSYGHLEIAQRDGDAATALRAGPGTPLTIKRRSQ